MASFKETLPHYEPEYRISLREWLAANYDKLQGVWLVLHKKGSDKTIITYDEVVEEVICFGWVDSVPNKLDEFRYKLMITPRKKGSGWSKVNKDRIVILQKNGLMTPIGQALIDKSIEDGSWFLLDAIEAGVVPQDLQDALNANPDAEMKFLNFSESNRKQIVRFVESAKRPETRTKRIQEVIEYAKLGKSAALPRTQTKALNS